MLSTRFTRSKDTRKIDAERGPLPDPAVNGDVAVDCLTMRETIDRPRPVPLPSPFVVSWSMPVPVSLTWMTT